MVIFDLGCLSSSVLNTHKTELIGQETQLAVDTARLDSPPKGLMKYLGKFKVTFYWIVREKDYPGPKSTPLYLENGSILGYFPATFIADFKKEACAELKDGKLISYLKKINKVRIVREFLGFNGYTISPLKSVAVDPEVIPLGSKLYIPALTKLSERQHNGIVYAHDIGSMIAGNSIDIFVGYKSDCKLLTDAGIHSSSLVDVYLLE